eukprot:985322-Pelagomonas_calceolata.AAC.1
MAFRLAWEPLASKSCGRVQKKKRAHCFFLMVYRWICYKNGCQHRKGNQACSVNLKIKVDRVSSTTPCLLRSTACFENDRGGFIVEGIQKRLSYHPSKKGDKRKQDSVLPLRTIHDSVVHGWTRLRTSRTQTNYTAGVGQFYTYTELANPVYHTLMHIKGGQQH